jgi:hypothetical protein
MPEFEFGGMTFRGGKMVAVLTALSTAGGAAWGGFEFYKDYMDMKEIIQNIDIDEIAAANELQLQKLDDAITYTTEIRKDLANDVGRLEGQIVLLEEQVQRAEATVRKLRNDVYAKLDTFEERFRLTLKDNYLNNGQYTVTTDDQNQPMSLTPKAVQTFYDKNEEMHGGSFNNLDKVYTSFKNQTTFSNNELLDANGIVGAKQTDGSYKIMITGNIEGANTEIAVKAGGGTQSGQTAQQMGVTKESKIGALSMPLSNEEAGKLYQALYKNNSTFQAWANKYVPEGSNKAIGPQPYKHTLPQTSKYASTRTVHTEYYIYEFLKTLENN